MKDPLLTNKIAGAAIAALLLIFGLPQLTAAIFGGGHGGGHGDELHLAYCCVDLDTKKPTHTDEPAPVDLGALLANASSAGGERRAALCKSCHTFGEGGANGAGPNLWNIVNREVATVPGFNYTGALQSFGGVWSYDRLDEYLKNSQSYVPGTAMAQRFARDGQRADILAYLGSLSSNPAAFPVPVVAEILDEAASQGSEHINDAADAIEGAVHEIVEAGSDVAEDAADIVEENTSEVEEALQPEEH